MLSKKKFWINLSLANLCIVALYGFTMRTKILFPLEFINFRQLESGHSHFAFGGWVGLTLITLLIYNILPAEYSTRKKYQYILWGIEISSLGMAVFLPLFGYTVLSIIFSSSYILITYAFAYIYIKDLLKFQIARTVRLLVIVSISCLLLSAIGPLGLLYIIVSQHFNSLLYRDSIYTFLHLQYNGFFTTAVVGIFLDFVIKKGIELPSTFKKVAVFLALSIIPSLFLSILWHNFLFFYILAAIGCVFIILTLIFFFRSVFILPFRLIYRDRLAKLLGILAFFSFTLKLFLNVGTIIPSLGNAIYGDRPVIIGFLHLVFLAFVTFYILSMLIEDGFFQKDGKEIRYPFYVFGAGVFSNEFFLMLQGLQILFETNSYIYNWLLWFASILLFTGAVLILRARLSSDNKKAIETSMARI
ncbi:MAG: hypothetical protein ACM3VS_09310 [Candidatus Dadabacteria bacterium]